MQAGGVKGELMDSFVDGYSLALLIVSMALFIRRYLTQNPPVYPYLIIATTCLVSNLVNDSGAGLSAVALLAGASFSFLGCLLYPSWRHMGQTPTREPLPKKET